MLNKKILLAPILAIALVLSIAAAVSYLPVSPQASPLGQPSPEPTPTKYSNVTPTAPNPSAGSYNAQTQTSPPTSPAAVATARPTAIPASTTSSVNFLPILSIMAAVVIGIVAALVLFSEKGLKKDLSGDGKS